MVVLHVVVTDDVIVDNRVLAGSKVPGLLLGIVWAVFQSLQLVVEVKDIVSLLITQGFVLVLSKSLNLVLTLKLPHLVFAVGVSEGLSDRIVLNFLGFHPL